MASSQPTFTVIGTGYVGLTTAVLLAESGYKVYALDLNQDRLATIKQGRSFFFEAGIDALVKHSVENGSLIPTDSYEASVPSSDYIFSCVGTPDNSDGSTNLSYVFAAAESTAKYIRNGVVYAQKSTVPVGTGAKVEKLFEDLGKKVSYVSNPEFLREGTAVYDSLWFDRIVVGSSDVEAANKVIGLYKVIEQHRGDIAKLSGIVGPKQHQGQYFTTNRNSAELIKVTANAFLALKISFANSIAKLADKTGADINEVMDVVGADKRIGRAFLNAGRGYGGGCFPKDVSGLISSGAENGVNLQIMTAAADLNLTMPGYIVQKAKIKLGTLKAKKVAVLGLAFKTGTSDARKSPGVALANLLKQQGAIVKVFDPESKAESESTLNNGIATADSIEDATNQAEAVFVATDWPVFINYDLAKLAKAMTGKLFFDAMNAFDKNKVQAAGLDYVGVGR